MLCATKLLSWRHSEVFYVLKKRCSLLETEDGAMRLLVKLSSLLWLGEVEGIRSRSFGGVTR